MTHTIMVLNTGSTSTKLAVYQNRENVLQKEYQHTREFLDSYPYMADQLPMRHKIAEEFLENEAKSFAPFSAIVARGGILCPIHSGGYVINSAMVDYLLNVCTEEHASNVAACIAFEMAKKYKIPHAFIYDGITTDELEPISSISGIPDMPRVAITHALNMRAIAYKAAADLKKQYAECTFAIAHLGGGISLSLHKHGRVVDVVADDEGPFSPERSGGQQVIRLTKYLENKQSLREKLRVMRGDSGLTGYFGTSDARKVEERMANGDRQAKLVYEAMALQIAKSLAGLAVSAFGELDALILTGGLAHSKRLTEMIGQRTRFIAPLLIYPGENEMESLAFGVCRILIGEETARQFEYHAEVKQYGVL
jgi:butyrate kinase